MKFLILYKKQLKILFIGILCITLLSFNYYGSPYATVYFGYAPRLIPIYCVDTPEKKVAISFDSAWGADKTIKIVEILKQYKVNATFFIVGFWAEDYPDMVKYLQENNIEIGTHSNTHPDLTTLSNEQIKIELESGIKVVENITNEKIKLFRPPFGAYNNTLIETASNLGLQTIQWDVDTLDWKGLRGVEICERVMSKVKNGSIILCHNNSDYILEALPLMLERLLNAGYIVTNVGDLIYKDNYKIDHLGTQKII